MTVNFRLPGPTPLPPEVIDALGQPMIPHRGPAFQSLFHDVRRLAQAAHRTDGEILIWPASGSAGWEVAVTNLLSPGDTILATVNGDFGHRFAVVAERFGLDVRRLDVPWGQPVLPAELRAALERHPAAKAVTLVHNETSTGVTNPVQELAAVVRDHGALVLLDAVSGVGALPLEMDAWGIDFVMSGSQKAWMCPPGLLIVAAGERAWQAQATSRFPRFFWDMAEARAMGTRGMTPTTPPISLLYAYHAALEMIAEETIEQVWERHQRLGALTRDGVRNAGLELFARRGFESNTVTAFYAPGGSRAQAFLSVLRDQYGVEAQAGQAHMSEKLVRIGHMGWVHEPEMREALAAIEGAAGHFVNDGARHDSLAEGVVARAFSKF